MAHGAISALAAAGAQREQPAVSRHARQKCGNRSLLPTPCLPCCFVPFVAARMAPSPGPAAPAAGSAKERAALAEPELTHGASPGRGSVATGRAPPRLCLDGAQQTVGGTLILASRMCAAQSTAVWAASITHRQIELNGNIVVSLTAVALHRLTAGLLDAGSPGHGSTALGPAAAGSRLHPK